MLKNRFAWLFVVIVFLTLAKLALGGRGFLAFPDEVRYVESVNAVENFVKGELRLAMGNIAMTHGRPGDVVMKMIPASLQYFSFKLRGGDLFSQSESVFLFGFNFVVASLLSVALYRFANWFLGNSFLALLSVAWFGALTNSFIYLRHALPYDLSLLLFLCAINHTVRYLERNKFNARNLFGIGALGFFAFLVYPGYFALLCVLFLWSANLEMRIAGSGKKIWQNRYFIAGCLVLLAIFELICQIGGKSYIWSAVGLSSTITQGTFEECFTFLFRYLWSVEGVTGLFLIAGLVCYLAQLIRNFNFNDESQKTRVTFVVLLLGSYIAYASLGYFLHFVVLYGRLLHQYLPFFCVFAVAGLRGLFRERTLVYVAVTIVMCVVFAFNIKALVTEYDYPIDVVERLQKQYPADKIVLYHEWAPYPLTPYHLNSVLARKGESPASTPVDAAVVVNADYFFPFSEASDYNPYTPPGTHLLSSSKKHFLTFAGYNFEGFGVKGRENLAVLPLTIRTYEPK